MCLVVNVASECGYTDSNYQQLMTLQKRFSNRGFTVLAFPSNQFGAQEPGSNSDIKHFAKTHYDVTFPLFSKINVIGEDAHPVYKYMASRVKQEPTWNFAKYLISRNGDVIQFYDTVIELIDIASDIDMALRIPHTHTDF